jgi:hypothetical protein
MSGGNMYFYPVPLYGLGPVQAQNNANGNIARVVNNMSWVTSNVAASQTITSAFGIFIPNGSGNNSSEVVLANASVSNSFSIAVTASGVSATISYPSITHSSGYVYTSTSYSTTAQLQSFWGTFTNHAVDLLFATASSLVPITPYVYPILGLWQSVSTAGANAGLSVQGLVGNQMSANAVPTFGASVTGNTNNSYLYWGYMTATTFNTTGAVSLMSNVNGIPAMTIYSNYSS